MLSSYYSNSFCRQNQHRYQDHHLASVPKTLTAHPSLPLHSCNSLSAAPTQAPRGLQPSPRVYLPAPSSSSPHSSTGESGFQETTRTQNFCLLFLKKNTHFNNIPLFKAVDLLLTLARRAKRRRAPSIRLLNESARAALTSRHRSRGPAQPRGSRPLRPPTPCRPQPRRGSPEKRRQPRTPPLAVTTAR